MLWIYRLPVAAASLDLVWRIRENEIMGKDQAQLAIHGELGCCKLSIFGGRCEAEVRGVRDSRKYRPNFINYMQIE